MDMLSPLDIPAVDDETEVIEKRVKKTTDMKNKLNLCLLYSTTSITMIVGVS
jgi:hypothetical protein